MIDHGPLSITEYAILASIGGDPISGMDAPEIASARSKWTGLLLRLEDRKLIRFNAGWVLTERGRSVIDGRVAQ